MDRPDRDDALARMRFIAQRRTELQVELTELQAGSDQLRRFFRRRRMTAVSEASSYEAAML